MVSGSILPHPPLHPPHLSYKQCQESRTLCLRISMMDITLHPQMINLWRIFNGQSVFWSQSSLVEGSFMTWFRIYFVWETGRYSEIGFFYVCKMVSCQSLVLEDVSGGRRLSQILQFLLNIICTFASHHPTHKRGQMLPDSSQIIF